MRNKRDFFIVLAAIVLAIFFGLSKTDSQQLAETLFEESPTQMIVPSRTPTTNVYVTQTESVQGISQSSAAPAKVVRVVDGDTIRVLIGSEEKTIRMIGVNTPETVDPRKEVECYGKEASAYAKELLEGQQIYLEADDSQGDQDKYQRLLRYVWLDNETNVNKLLIADGYAYEYTYDLPYKYQAEFKQAQQEAKQAERGLWKDDACGK